MRDLIDKSFDNVADVEDLISAYRLILCRNPEKNGYEHYVKLIKKGLFVDKLFSEFINSKEYKNRTDVEIDEPHQQFYHLSATSLQDMGKDNILLNTYLPVEKYDHLYNNLVDSQPSSSREYFRYHRRRYYELFNAMAYYLKGKAEPRVLDVGVSGFLPIYKKLHPNIVLVTIDRPTYQHGFNAEYCVKTCGAKHHYSADLNRVSLSQSWGTPSLGAFDFIVFTEVLEHLVVNPIDLLSDIISLLKPDGHLYLTTPNFFQHGYLRQIERRENPQQIFPRRGENYDAHHHFREYSMNELLRFIQESGGEVENYYFSDCWDDGLLKKTFLLLHPDQRSNLVIISKAKR